MVGEPGLARNRFRPSDWRRIRRILLFILILPIALPASCALYVGFVPAHSASFHIDEVDTTVSLSFYWVWDETRDDGRYFSVRAPTGTIKHKMCGFDWAHWSRTSIYLTNDRGLAILGFHDCDYFIPLPRLTVTRSAPAQSDAWRYLGAFDLVHSSTGVAGTRHMRFIPAAEQAECIIMGGSNFVHDGMTRKHARQPRCP